MNHDDYITVCWYTVIHVIHMYYFTSSLIEIKLILMVFFVYMFFLGDDRYQTPRN